MAAIRIKGTARGLYSADGTLLTVDPGTGTRGPEDPRTRGPTAVTGDRNTTTSQNSWLYHCLECASQLGTNRKTFSAYSIVL